MTITIVRVVSILQEEREAVRKFILLTKVLLLFVSTSCFSGCYSIIDEIQKFEINLRNQAHSSYSWMRVEDNYDDLEHKRHFRDGFKAGYQAAAWAGDVCPPSIPPQKYWSARYQNPEGREKVHAWFEGYSHGVIEANADGIPFYTEIPTIGLEHMSARNQIGHEVSLDDLQPKPGAASSKQSDSMFPVPEPAPLKEPQSVPASESESLPPITNRSRQIPSNDGPRLAGYSLTVSPGSPPKRSQSDDGYLNPEPIRRTESQGWLNPDPIRR